MLAPPSTKHEERKITKDYPVSTNLKLLHNERKESVFKLKKQESYAEALQKLEIKSPKNEYKSIERAASITSYTDFRKKRDSSMGPSNTVMLKRTIEEPVAAPNLVVNGFEVTKESANFTNEGIDKFEFYTAGASFDACHPHYIIGKTIGHGSYAQVRQGRHKGLYYKVAIKIYDKEKMLEPTRRRNLKREILLVNKIRHPSIVGMYEAFDSKKQVFIVQEFLPGGSLH